MADNVEANPGSGGAIFATDDNAGVQHPYTKMEWGADGVFTPVSSGAAAIPIQDGGNSITVDGTLTVEDGGGAVTVDWAGTAPPIGAGVEATALRVTVATDSTGVLSVDDNGSSLTVDGTVTANAGTNLNTSALALEATLAGVLTSANFAAAFGTAGTADTQVMSVQGIASMTPVQVSQATATNLNAVVVGSVAHDTGTPGNPVTVAGTAQNMDDTAPPNRVSAESDVTRIATDRDGVLFAHPHGAQIWSKHLDGSTAYTDESIHASPGAGLSLYVTDIVVSTGSATAMNVFFEEGASKVLGPWYLEAVAGRGIHIAFVTPKKITADTALTVTTSASIAQSIDVQGFVGAS